MSELPQKWDALPQVKFDLLQRPDVDVAVDFIVDHYFTQLPLTESLRLDVENEVRPWLNEYVGHVMGHQLSLIVRQCDDHNQIVALVLNNLHAKHPHSGDLTQISFADPGKRPVWSVYCKLMEDIRRHVQFDQDPLISMEFVTVSKQWSNRGLATRCVDIVHDLAKKRNIHLITAEVANEFLAKVLAKEDFGDAQVINLNYYHQHGKKPFVTDSVHDKIRLMYKIVE